jgi:Flp pilus assembly protein TadG
LKSGSSGQAAAEFGIAATVLLLLIFGVMNLGSAVYDYNTIANAGREAVRYAAIHSPTSASPSKSPYTDVKQVVVDYAPGLNLTTSQVDVSFQKDTRMTTRYDAIVTVTYAYTLNMPFMNSTNLTFTSTAQMLASQ